MGTYEWYFDNGDEVMETVEEVKNTFPCFVSVENIELDWVIVTVTARTEDIKSIERKFAKFA